MTILTTIVGYRHLWQMGTKEVLKYPKHQGFDIKLALSANAFCLLLLEVIARRAIK